jgi:hypothetical protein
MHPEYVATVSNETGYLIQRLGGTTHHIAVRQQRPWLDGVSGRVSDGVYTVESWDVC